MKILIASSLFLIILQLAEIIDWPWIIILAPIWIIPVLWMAGMGMIALIAVAVMWFRK